MASAKKSTYTLTKSERQKINKIAHKRTSSKEGFIRQRTRLRVLFSIILAADISFEQIEELTKSNDDILYEELIKQKNIIMSLR